MLNSLGSIFAEGSLFILVLTAFAFVNPAVAIAAVLYFGLIGILIQTFLGRVMNRTSAKINSSTVDANTQITDIGQVQRELTTLGTQDYFYDRIYETRLSAAKSTAMQNVLNGLPRHIVETSLIVGLAAFIISESTSGNLVESAATLAIFLSGGLRLTASLLPLQSALLSIKQSVPAAKRALAFLEDEVSLPGHVFNRGSVVSTPVPIEVKEVSFSFLDSSSEVLDGISMSVPSGSQIALIGASGAGKSTLADLILGLLRPSSGQIRVDDVDPYELLRTSPGQLGYVPQRPGMVSGTIAQNIALGVPQDLIDHQRLNSSLVDSNLISFIDSLPDGINTNLGKRRDELSGGQLQRIGLARALYSNPRLLVMDEATSALDAESENEINVALDLLRGKVTVILIAHRLNTIQRSDIVYFIEQGRIVAEGSFSHLLKTNPTVRNLAKLMSIDTDSEQT
jgi:ATP-binding cassette subfamily C protein